MEIEVIPPLPAAEQQALRVALERAGLRLDDHSAVYASNWRRAGLREAVDDEPEAEPKPHTLSPRSTRGATRA